VSRTVPPTDKAAGAATGAADSVSVAQISPDADLPPPLDKFITLYRDVKAYQKKNPVFI
jgi:hypothetical protein